MLSYVLFASMLAQATHATPVRVRVAPEVDGRTTDRVWRDVPAEGGFVQSFPADGGTPSAPTRVRIAYDDRAVYLAVECPQPDVPVVSRLTRRDHPVESDWVEVDLDTRDDGKSAFSFSVNAAGVLYDSLRFDDTDESSDWDVVWQGAAARTSDGWSAELAIPLRVLRFPHRPVQEWGMEIRRHISAKQETDEWAWISRTSGGEVSRYGRVGPFDSLAPAHGLELAPFATAGLLRRTPIPGVPLRTDERRFSVGLDARWHLREDLSLDATLNPDFGQVEADEVVLNLSNVETFFPEKRSFFLDGMDLFQTPTQVLYTRRIGHVPAEPALPDGRELIAPPPPATIWGAAKLTGTVAGLRTGVLSAVTAPENVIAQDPSGARGPMLSDPLTAYEVVRLSRDLSEQTRLGLIGTAALRDEPRGAWPRVPARGGTFGPSVLCPDGTTIPAGARCTHDAMVGGLDGRWRSPAGDYVLLAQALGSRIEGGPDRVLRDGTVIRAGDADAAGILELVRQGGAHWIWDASVEGYGRRYDPDDVGYLDRQNAIHYALDVGWRDTAANGWSVQRRTQFEFFRRQNLDGLDLGTGYQLNERGDLPNFWHFFVELHDRPAHFDDREIGDGTALERAGLFGLETSLSTDPRRALVFDAGTAHRLRTNGWAHEVDASIDANLHPQLGLGLGVGWTYTDGEPRFVGGERGSYLFARQRAQSISLTLRGGWTFSTTLTLQAYAQLFAAYERFGSFATFTGDSRVIRLRDLAPASAPSPSNAADVQAAELNANVVLRWEYRPGSTLFFVYTRSSSPLTDLGTRPSRLDLATAPAGPSTDALEVKLTLWWG